MTRLLLTSIALTSFLAGPALADWTTQPMVLDSAHINGSVPTMFQPLSDAAGGAYLIAGRGNLRTSRVDDAGALYPGFPVFIAHGMAVSDGAGGVVVVFSDGNGDIRAAHVLANGAVDPAWPAGDLLVCGADGAQSKPIACRDGAGGAFVVWQDARVAPPQLFAHHVLAGGTTLYGATNGVALASIGFLDYTDYTVAPDGVGGAIVAWGARAQRLSASLALLWTPGGRPLPGSYAFRHHIVGDGAGGAFIAWDGNHQAKLWKLDANGNLAAGWPSDPVSPGADTDEPTIVSDGAAGVLLAWTGLSSARALRIGADGSIAAGWPAGGFAFSSGLPASQVDLLADGGGGALAVYGETAGSGAYSLVAQRFTHQGALAAGWTRAGQVIRSTEAAAQDPTLVAVEGGAVVMWWERHAAQPFGYHDDLVLAQHISESGTVSAPPPAGLQAIVLGAPRPNPSRGIFALSVSLPGDAPATIELLDIGGRRLQAADVRGAGVREVTLGRGLALSPGLYFVRLRQGGTNRITRVAIAR